MIKIETNGYEVLESGTVYSPGLGDTTFTLSEAPRMEVVVRVEQDNKKSDKKIRLEAINDYTLAFIFTNPSGISWGNASPAKIGHLNGKEVYATFNLGMMGNKVGSAIDISYTFLLKEITHE